MANKGSIDDRLSALHDAALIHVLSFLPTDEAARTSALSRRWRRLHAAVPAVDLVDPNAGRDGYSSRGSGGQLPMCFDQKVTCALLGRDPAAPIRAFRLDAFHPAHALLGQWVVLALRSGAEELELKLRCGEYSRLRLCPFGHYVGSSADFHDGDRGRYVRTPRHLFHSAAPQLRRLSLSRWRLDLPPGEGALPMTSLRSLVLHRIMGDGQALQRLVSSCPRLVDLALEECPGVATLTVAAASLRRFALVCCHNATHVRLETRALRSLRYKGGLLVTGHGRSSFFWIADHAAVTALTVDICEGVHGKTPREIATVTELVARCANLEFLHLALRPAMAYYSGMFTSVLRRLPRLRRMELKGSLHSEHGVGSVSALLHNTPRLEELSLFPVLPDPPEKKKDYLYEFEDMYDEHGSGDGDKKEAISCGGPVYVPRGTT
nr:unnamed protein product [Digitaria exilis]